MNSIELKELLAEVVAPISAIERRVGIPKNVLQQSLKGSRDLPKEWVARLKEFVEKKQYIGLRRKKKELIFAKPTTKKKEKPLDTKIDYKVPDEKAYDGEKINRFLGDEYGQTGKMEKKPFMSDAIKKKLGL